MPQSADDQLLLATLLLVQYVMRHVVRYPHGHSQLITINTCYSRSPLYLCTVTSRLEKKTEGKMASMRDEKRNNTVCCYYIS